jgi:hypothetical protein
MSARNVSIHLKSNMFSDYTRTFENDVLPLPRKQKGFKGENEGRSWGQEGKFRPKVDAGLRKPIYGLNSTPTVVCTTTGWPSTR